MNPQNQHQWMRYMFLYKTLIKTDTVNLQCRLIHYFRNVSWIILRKNRPNLFDVWFSVEHFYRHTVSKSEWLQEKAHKPLDFYIFF